MAPWPFTGMALHTAPGKTPKISVTARGSSFRWPGAASRDCAMDAGTHIMTQVSGRGTVRKDWTGEAFTPAANGFWSLDRPATRRQGRGRGLASPLGFLFPHQSSERSKNGVAVRERLDASAGLRVVASAP